MPLTNKILFRISVFLDFCLLPSIFHISKSNVFLFTTFLRSSWFTFHNTGPKIVAWNHLPTNTALKIRSTEQKLSKLKTSTTNVRWFYPQHSIPPVRNRQSPNRLPTRHPFRSHQYPSIQPCPADWFPHISKPATSSYRALHRYRRKNPRDMAGWSHST